MNRRFDPTTKARMAGVGMLEILIALLILSIGVLGMSQLQGTATRQNFNGYLRSQATFLAFSIADRMRSNQDDAARYGIAMGTTESDVTSGSKPAMVKNDLANWLGNLDRLLPSGQGEIVVPAGANGTYTITVQYDITAQYAAEDPDGDGLDTVKVSVETEIAS